MGGGIAGLAAAWTLRHGAQVTVFDPGELGGKLQTTAFAGRLVDCGPDAFLTRVPAAVELCQELGIDDLVAPAAGRSQLWWHGKLCALPDGLVLGAPTRWGPLWRSGLCSPWEVARAALDEVLPRRPLEQDLSVGGLISYRYGRAVSERLVDPLVGGIHAGRVDSLSAEVTAPQLLAAARRSRSLARGLRAAQQHAAVPRSPVFLTPRAGSAAMVARLVTELEAAGVAIRRQRIERLRLVGHDVGLDPVAESFDAAVLAVPSWVAAKLLGGLAPGELGAIEWASVALVTLAYTAQELPTPAGVNGFLVPRTDGRLMSACSFGSSKWPHWAEPGQVILRVSAGRDGDQRAERLDDQALVEQLAAEVNLALGSHAEPRAWRVSRWPRSFPQYRVGHLARVTAIDQQLGRRLPQVALAGASYRGSGIPACITSGRQAAQTLLSRATAD